MPMFVGFQMHRCIFTCKHKNTQTAAAPSLLPCFKMNTVAEFFRAMTGQQKQKRKDGSADIYRQPPGKRTEVKFTFTDIGIWCGFELHEILLINDGAVRKTDCQYAPFRERHSSSASVL